MRLLCLIRGHNPEIIREEWVPPDPKADRIYPTFLQYSRCLWCKTTWATATNPDDRHSRWSLPRRVHEMAAQ